METILWSLPNKEILRDNAGDFLVRVAPYIQKPLSSQNNGQLLYCLSSVISELWKISEMVGKYRKMIYEYGENKGSLTV